MRTGGGKGEALSRDTRRLQSQPDEGKRPCTLGSGERLALRPQVDLGPAGNFGWCFCCEGRSLGPGRRFDSSRPGRLVATGRGRSVSTILGARRRPYRGVSIFVYTRRAVHRKNH